VDHKYWLLSITDSGWRSLVELFAKGAAWQDFADLESELIEIMSYVPLRKKHNDVWSRKFGRLLDETGSAVDSFFKVVMAGGRLFEGKSKKEMKDLDIVDYRKVIGPTYRLAEAQVVVSDGIAPYAEMDPFVAFASDKSPNWWKAYNNYKHSRYADTAIATLRNSVEALAGLFILNVLHKENQAFLVEKGVIRATYGPGDKGIINALAKSDFGIVAGYKCEAKSQLFDHMFRRDGV